MLESRLNKGKTGLSPPEQTSHEAAAVCSAIGDLPSAQSSGDGPSVDRQKQGQPAHTNAPDRAGSFKVPAQHAVGTPLAGALTTCEPHSERDTAQKAGAADLLPARPSSSQTAAGSGAAPLPEASILPPPPPPTSIGLQPKGPENGGQPSGQPREQDAKRPSSGLDQHVQPAVSHGDGIIDLTSTDDHPASPQRSLPATQPHAETCARTELPAETNVDTEAGTTSQCEADAQNAGASASHKIATGVSQAASHSKGQPSQAPSQLHQADHPDPAADHALGSHEKPSLAHLPDGHTDGLAGQKVQADKGTEALRAAGQASSLSLSHPERFQSEVASMLKMGSPSEAPRLKQDKGVHKPRRKVRRQKSRAEPPAASRADLPGHGRPDHAARHSAILQGHADTIRSILKDANSSRPREGPHASGEGRDRAGRPDQATRDSAILRSHADTIRSILKEANLSRPREGPHASGEGRDRAGRPDQATRDSAILRNDAETIRSILKEANLSRPREGPHASGEGRDRAGRPDQATRDSAILRSHADTIRSILKDANPSRPREGPHASGEGRDRATPHQGRQSNERVEEREQSGRHQLASQVRSAKSPRSPVLGMGQHLQMQRMPGSRRLMIALSSDSGSAHVWFDQA